MWLIDLIHGRCPHCRRASIFSGVWQMNDTCPHCHIRFEREQGYFTMAIFVAYLIGFVLIGLSVLGLWWATVPFGLVYALVPTAVLITAVPLLFRYGRIIWLYIDEWLDPHPA